MLGLFIHSRLLQVFQRSSWVVLWKQLVDFNISAKPYCDLLSTMLLNRPCKLVFDKFLFTLETKNLTLIKGWCLGLASSAAIYLPELLQLVDLLCSDLASPKLLLFRGDLHQPGQKTAILDQWLPLWAIPIDVLQTALAGTGLSVERQRGKTASDESWQWMD